MSDLPVELTVVAKYMPGEGFKIIGFRAQETYSVDFKNQDGAAGLARWLLKRVNGAKRKAHA